MIDLYIFVMIPILFAIIIYFLNNYLLIKRIAIVFEILLLVPAILNFLYIKNNGTILQNIGGWSEYAGISLKADLMSMTLVILTIILFLAMIVYTYAKKYINRLFVFLFIILQALISGIFLSNDFFNIYVLLELSTVVVSILIMFKKDSRSMYDGMVYLLVNIVAATLFLFGLGFLYKTLGVLDITGVHSRINEISNPQALIIPYALMITTVSLKAALMPLFSWLPKAHGTPSAPSVVSAILSGLYVKIGLYLFIRIQEVFIGQFNTADFFLITGLLTGIIGFLLAWCQTDIKLILAYHTISQIGLIMIGLNYSSDYSYWGAIYHIINHAFFKSVLFLTAGIIIEEYKTRNIYQIKGVWHKMPLVAISSILAILGITGAPFFNGSISKYFIQSGLKGDILEYGLLFINLGTIISFVKYSTIFFGSNKVKKVKIDKYRNVVIISLGLMCFVGGIFGQHFIRFLFDQSIPIDFTEYMQKAVVYILNIAIGIIIYKKVISKLKILHKVRSLEFSFNSICATMFVFLGSVLIYLLNLTRY